MGESEISEQPKQTTATEDLYSAGRHLWDAAWKINEAQVKAVVGAAQTVGQFVQEHPGEVAVTAVAGLPGLAVMKGGQEIYAENKDDLAPIVKGAADAGQMIVSGVEQVSASTAKRLQENMAQKPVTSALELVVSPILPVVHASVSAAVRPGGNKAT